MKKNNKKTRNDKAITLIALVITIIILLILAGISIAQLTGNGLFEKAKLAKEESKNAQEDEDDKIKQYENEISGYVDGNRGYETTIKKLEERIAELENANSYSTTEEKVVGTWIDGKPIYKITINLGSSIVVPNNSWLETNFSGTAHNIDVLLDGYGTNGNLDAGFNEIITTRTCPVMTAFSVDALNSQNIYIMASRVNASPRLQYITIQYTKTTD